jgi:hypothetical protein
MNKQLLFDFKQALDGTGDWFSVKLFQLFLKADVVNTAKLSQAYPEHGEIVRAFRSGELKGKL